MTQSSTADREIVTERLFNAPPEIVWAAWTDPTHVAQWWGPNGFTNTIQEMSVKPGGVWRFIMHGPDGTDYPNKIVYSEVKKPEKLVYAHGADDGPPHFHTTVLFIPKDNKTIVRMFAVFPTAAARDYVVKNHGAIEGGKQTLNRMAEHIAQRPIEVSEETPFVITRTFDAPRDLIWKAWTEQERLKEWFGPKGLATKYSKLDFRPGGTHHYMMETPDGRQMWGKFVYREIRKPERLVWVNFFSDKDGGLTSHPMSTDPWPLEMLTTVTFAESEGKTTITIQWSPINPTAGERDTFAKGFSSMNMGWGGTFKQLEEYLAAHKS